MQTVESHVSYTRRAQNQVNQSHVSWGDDLCSFGQIFIWLKYPTCRFKFLRLFCSSREIRHMYLISEFWDLWGANGITHRLTYWGVACTFSHFLCSATYCLTWAMFGMVVTNVLQFQHAKFHNFLHYWSRGFHWLP